MNWSEHARQLRLITAIIATAFTSQWQNKPRFIARYLTLLVHTTTIALIWRFIYTQDFTATWSVTYQQMVLYFIVAQTVLFLSPRLIHALEEDFRTQSVSYSLLRPQSYLLIRYSEAIGVLLANTVFFLPVQYFFAWVLIDIVIPLDLALLIVLLLFIASLIHSLVQMIIGVMAYWLNDAVILYRVYVKLLVLFGGMYLPTVLYPDWLQPFVFFGPLWGIVAMPASVTLPTAAPSYALLIPIMLLWVVAMLLLLRWLYRKTLHHIMVGA